MKLKLLVITIITFVLYSCASNRPVEKGIDKALIGTWVGGKESKECDSSWWRITRSENGTYSVSIYSDKERQNLDVVETGIWWTINGKLFLQVPGVMEVPDDYAYQVVNKNKVSLTSGNFDETAICKEDYKFTDIRE